MIIVKSVLVSEVSTLWNEIMRRMVLTNISSRTISVYYQVFRSLIEYLNSREIKQYSEDIGKEFLADVEKNKGLSKSTLTRYVKTIARLDSCMNGDFWYEGYGLDKYIIKNDSIQKLYDKICLDLDILKSKATTRKRVKLCIFRLDIFMYENDLNDYTPLVGKKFLEFMRLHSTYMDHSFQYTYVLTIERLDSYWRNEKPKMRIPSDYEIHNSDLQKGLDDLIIILKDKQFKEKSISNAIYVIKQLDFYMRNQEISCYSSDVGKQFLIDIKRYWKPRDEDGYAVPVIAHLDDVIAGKNFVRYHLKKDYSVISQFSDSFNLFMHECEEKGNRNSTLNEKKLYCNSFFDVLINIGLDDIGKINADYVVEACSSLPPKVWATVKAYLSSSFINGLVDKDYTYLVPRKRTKSLIPPYYNGVSLRSD